MLRELVERRVRDVPPPHDRLPRPAARARRVRVEGTVQGVGFRPYVYRLAGELGLGGYVLNDARGVLIEVEGGAAAVAAFLARLAAEAPPLARVERGRGARRCDRPATAGFAIRESDRGGDAPTRRSRRTRDLRRLPARAARSRRPPLPLPVHQLHQLRPALHDRARRPLRPAADDDGRLRDVPALPGRVRRSRRPPLPRPAQRLPALRPAVALLDAAGAPVPLGDARDAVQAAAPRCAPARSWRVKGIGGYHLACRADDEARGGRAARAQAPRGQAVRADGRRPRAAAQRLVELGPLGRELLVSPRAADRARAAAGRRAASRRRSAPGAPELGVMLPYTPLHHLLLRGRRRRRW